MRHGWLVLCLASTASLGCATQGKPAAADTTGSARADHPFARCFFAYRETQSSVPMEVELGVSPAADEPSTEREVGSFRVRVSETKDESNGAGAVSVWYGAGEAPADAWLGHTLYQLGAGNQALSLTMGGGHGFTGLHYVQHPSSGAELQWWCVQAQDP